MSLGHFEKKSGGRRASDLAEKSSYLLRFSRHHALQAIMRRFCIAAKSVRASVGPAVAFGTNPSTRSLRLAETEHELLKTSSLEELKRPRRKSPLVLSFWSSAF